MSTYETPALVEVGDFADVTLGLPSGCPNDWFWALAWIGC